MKVAANAEAVASHLHEEFDFVFHAAALDHIPAAALDEASLAAGRSVLMDAIATARALISNATRARLWIATCGAQPVLSSSDGWNAIHTPLWGLGHTSLRSTPIPGAVLWISIRGHRLKRWPRRCFWVSGRAGRRRSNCFSRRPAFGCAARAQAGNPRLCRHR